MKGKGKGTRPIMPIGIEIFTYTPKTLSGGLSRISEKNGYLFVAIPSAHNGICHIKWAALWAA